MKLTQKVELKVENLEKCYLVADTDCPLGQLYDFACYIKSFFLEKMKEQEDKEKEQVKVENG